MDFERLTTMNQYGDIIYIGRFKKNNYRNIGDYPEFIARSTDDEYKENVFQEVIKKLYYLEEGIEDFIEDLERFKRCIDYGD